MPLPADWAEWVNPPQTEAAFEVLRRCVARGSPYGDDGWTAAMVERLGLQTTLRPRGRPRKQRTRP